MSGQKSSKIHFHSCWMAPFPSFAQIMRKRRRFHWIPPSPLIVFCRFWPYTPSPPKKRRLYGWPHRCEKRFAKHIQWRHLISTPLLHKPGPGVRGRLCNPSYWDGGIWGWLMDREPPKTQNDLQRVCTIPEVRLGSVCITGLLWDQTEFQSAWVCVAAWFQARGQVWFLSAAV